MLPPTGDLVLPEQWRTFFVAAGGWPEKAAAGADVGRPQEREWGDERRLRRGVQSEEGGSGDTELVLGGSA